jgi:hypothetical protein
MDPMRVVANVVAGKQLRNIGRTDNHPVRAGYPQQQDRQRQPHTINGALGEAASAAAPVKRRGKLKAVVGVVGRLSG